MQKIIVGLGNYGDKYAKTRHNAGFGAIDCVAEKHNVRFSTKKFEALAGTGTIAGFSCLLLKPLTFMNSSGISVSAATDYFGLDVSDLIVLVDDISLEPGKIRIRRKGSSGGHNGIRNIIDMIGNENFVRIKIGVGKKPHENYDLADWVLSKFNKNDMVKMQEAYFDVNDAIELVLNEKIEEAMNRFN